MKKKRMIRQSFSSLLLFIVCALNCRKVIWRSRLGQSNFISDVLLMAEAANNTYWQFNLYSTNLLRFKRCSLCRQAAGGYLFTQTLPVLLRNRCRGGCPFFYAGNFTLSANCVNTKRGCFKI